MKNQFDMCIIGRDMANERFHVCFIGLLLFWPGSESYKQRPNYRGLVGKEIVLMWPYLCQFVTYSTDFVYLDVFHFVTSSFCSSSGV